MKRLEETLLGLVPPRYRNSVKQLVRFGAVGASGVVVNNLALIICNVLGRDLLHIGNRHVLMGVPFSAYNVRYYHLYVMLAFLVANLYNFVINRHWTFKGQKPAPFWHEYTPFLLVGLAAQLVGLVLMTLLMHPESPIGLPDSIFDDSSGLRTKLYWANLIVIGFVTPINFVFNKLYTFQHVRHRHHQNLESRAAQSQAGSDVTTDHLGPRP